VNEKNVEALEATLDELSGEAICERDLMVATLARALDARGVLTRDAYADLLTRMLDYIRRHTNDFGDNYPSAADMQLAADVRKALRIRDVADSERGRRAAQDVAETDHLARRREP
jgi:hypothetical protein